jgi:hypothetical protein
MAIIITSSADTQPGKGNVTTIAGTGIMMMKNANRLLPGAAAKN